MMARMNKLPTVKRFQDISNYTGTTNKMFMCVDVHCGLNYELCDIEADGYLMLSPKHGFNYRSNEVMKTSVTSTVIKLNDLQIKDHVKQAVCSSSKDKQDNVNEVADREVHEDMHDDVHEDVVAGVHEEVHEEVHEDDYEETLPLVQGQHSDLKYISAQTLESILLRNQEHKKNIVIVDCRYPYEYNGGHIKGAINLYRREDIIDTFITRTINCGININNSILIFHCEFSSERGPKLCRFLREQDRVHNRDRYPLLCYSHIYVLHGGYKTFYQQCTTELCHPQQYIPMVEKRFNTQLKYHKKETKKWMRSKSWSGVTQHAKTMTKINRRLSFEL